MRPHYWHNWVGNQEAMANYYRPRSLAELQDNVRAAAQRGRVRPVGRSYAWSPLIANDDSLIDLGRLDGLLGVTGGPKPTITVEAGITMEQLTRLANQQNLTLRSPTIFPRVSIGGVVTTGSHGTGRLVQTFADGAAELTFVRPDGDLLTIARGDPRWPAAAVSLGSFGPLYSVKLEVEPAFNVRVEEKQFPIDVTLAGIVDAVHTYEFVEHYWFPFDTNMWLMAVQRSDDRLDRPTLCDRVSLLANGALAEVAGNVALPIIARHAPQLTPLMMKIAPGFQFKEGETVEPSALQFHYVTAYPKMYDMEYALPLERAAEAWHIVMKMVADQADRDRFPVNFTVHARYIKASDALMAPAHRVPSSYREGILEDPVNENIMCMIEVVTAVGTPGRDEFYARLATAWADIGGRPHWGKMLYHPRRLKADYGPAMADFEAVRASVDPNRRFLNRYLEHEVLQLP